MWNDNRWNEGLTYGCGDSVKNSAYDGDVAVFGRKIEICQTRTDTETFEHFCGVKRKRGLRQVKKKKGHTMEDDDDEQDFEIRIDSKCESNKQTKNLTLHSVSSKRTNDVTDLCNNTPNSKIPTPTIFVKAESTTPAVPCWWSTPVPIGCLVAWLLCPSLALAASKSFSFSTIRKGSSEWMLASGEDSGPCAAWPPIPWPCGSIYDKDVRI